jgi:hypothetical protein
MERRVGLPTGSEAGAQVTPQMPDKTLKVRIGSPYLERDGWKVRMEKWTRNYWILNPAGEVVTYFTTERRSKREHVYLCEGREFPTLDHVVLFKAE